MAALPDGASGKVPHPPRLLGHRPLHTQHVFTRLGQHFYINCSLFLFFTLHAISLDRILIKFNETKLQEMITVSGQALSIETIPHVHF